ncbi:MAG TPA: UDP-N-acetylmuramate:L-alanyl-gamma-D-glutamyl-meso-diaminopimelate ligase [Steroidobacteraceae bacterium]|jgi:UDP-N-acetylmuramate: L-alanyl-gamma-D-glutamyl-meso-diaminopimelate ligase|nr:UDP-N-acetylmuramate:L-alanyl-gamma-D-glutamyl-meso-diaminopimelate ligase [Steroidobacteraceae bacterium]
MHVHILGICGTFMGGIAAIAKSAGHRVTGSDRNVYPPMSTQLEALGIELIQGFDAAQLKPRPDVVVVGNVMTRGVPVIEALLDSGIAYTSGPEWLAREVLRDVHVLGVAGTHGKTTTSSMLAWILEHAGLKPGFLIGGVPGNFSTSARFAPGTKYFVIEADEYDTAFFDKRAKFVHYRARTVVLNNLEFDHADIYEDLGAIQKQFHHLVRTVPASGCILWNAADANLAATLQMGAWTPLEGFSRQAGSGITWSLDQPQGADFSKFVVLEAGRPVGTVRWNLLGAHNAENALAAIGAARHVGITVSQSIAALAEFKGVKRRMELRGEVAGISVYDDFAHHPTAIASTIDGLRRKVGDKRIVAVLEPRSATMRMGVHRDTLAPSLAAADAVWMFAPPDLGWDADAVVGTLGAKGHLARTLDELLAGLMADTRTGDQVLIMSNGGFGGLHGRLLEALARRS